jgi:enamine deaminase RidA (YjgF/YER057c/UK114 family)
MKSSLFFLIWMCLVGINTGLLAQSPEDRLADMGITLYPTRTPVANYVPVVRTGNLLFLSGTGPFGADGQLTAIGKVGADLTIEEGVEAARITAIRQISVLKATLGDLSKVKRIVKVLGMVQCSDTFYQQPIVINGYSDMMVAVFGEAGKHARSAVGMYSLYLNMPVEVEMIVEIEED